MYLPHQHCTYNIYLIVSIRYLHSTSTFLMQIIKCIIEFFIAPAMQFVRRIQNLLQHCNLQTLHAIAELFFGDFFEVIKTGTFLCVHTYLLHWYKNSK